MPSSPPCKLPGHTVLIIFAKEPTPGRVKTRLCPPLSSQAAARLYGQFLADVFEEMVQLTQISLAIAYTPDDARLFFQKFAPPGFQFLAQAGGDLGERLRQAFAWGFARGAETVLIRNSDSPDLPALLVLEAQEILGSGRSHVVLGPCPDGGYYLVGLKNPQPQLFQSITWSGPTVLEETLAQGRRLGLTMHLLPSWLDIDTVEDLQTFVKSPKISPAPGWRSYRLAKALLADL